MDGKLFELNHLRSFVAVAKELNFRRAAARLNMTQPPLSRHISLLEHAVGVRLLDRNNRSVRLTAAGRRFLGDAVDILKRAESAALFARQSARGESGSLVLGFVPSASVEVIPRILGRVERDLPGVQLIPGEMMTFEIIEALHSGGVEIGLFRLPPRQTGLNIHKVWSEGFVLVVPHNHPFATKPDLCAEDLNDTPFIGFSTERGGFLFDVVQGFFSARGISPDTRYSVAQSHTVMTLVNEGLGVALVPASITKTKMADTVVRDIGLPMDLCSDLYMGLGPKEPDRLVREVSALITDELSRPAR